MADNINVKLLKGRWIHSHEECEGDRLIFRTSTFNFPPSRARNTITLKPDDAVTVDYPGPVDRSAKASGRWDFDGNFLTITAPIWSGTFKVETVDSDKLIMVRIRKEK